LSNGTCYYSPGYIAPYVYTFDGTNQFSNPYPDIPFTLTKPGNMNPMASNCYYTGKCFETWGATGASIQFSSFNSAEMTIGFFFKVPPACSTADTLIEFSFGTKYLRVNLYSANSLQILGNLVNVIENIAQPTIPPYSLSANFGPFIIQSQISVDWRHLTVVLNTTYIAVYINGGIAGKVSQATNFFGSDSPNVRVFGSFLYYDHLIIIPSFLSQNQVIDLVSSLTTEK
jgi:hypothetical protein